LIEGFGCGRGGGKRVWRRRRLVINCIKCIETKEKVKKKKKIRKKEGGKTTMGA
jgi:hypothetical protein